MPDSSAYDSTVVNIIAETLNRHPDYKVLHRVPELSSEPRSVPQDLRDGWTQVGIVDTETTGIDTTKDKIIELGLTILYVDEKGIVKDIGPRISMFEDPGEPLSEEVKKITGLTDKQLFGELFDDERFTSLMDRCHLIIAHNAKFDRPLIERRFPKIAGKFWACSMEEIDWKSYGAPSNSLEAILWSQGWFFNAHRALDDCDALAWLLSLSPPPDESFQTPVIYMQMLMDSARLPTYRVWAYNSPFEAKDALKSRGYKWHDGKSGPAKSWYADFKDQRASDEEVIALKENKLCTSPKVQSFTAQHRYAGLTS